MEWVIVVAQLLPYVVELMKIVERLFANHAKTGPQKKELVENAVKAVVADKPPIVRTKAVEAIGDIIDVTAGYLFPHDNSENIEDTTR